MFLSHSVKELDAADYISSKSILLLLVICNVRIHFVIFHKMLLYRHQRSDGTCLPCLFAYSQHFVSSLMRCLGLCWIEL